MKTELLHITDKNVNRIFFGASQSKGATNSESRRNMKKILFDAIQHELTDRQKSCLVEYYLNGKKEKDIALELNLSPSTVSRHISFAKKKLRKIASYYS